MAKGKYERTPLSQARFKLTMTQQRIEKLRGLLATAEADKQQLENTIKELQEAESK